MNIMMTPFYPVIAAAAIDVDGTIIIQMVVFLCVIIFLHYTLYRPFLRTYEARQEGVEGSREEAAELEARAAMMLSDFDTKMTSARREAQEIRETLRTQAVEEHNEIIEEVREEIATKIAAERAQIDAKISAAHLELSARSQQLAKAMVDKVISAA